MLRALVVAAALAVVAPAIADPLELTLDKVGYRNTGILTLREPVSGRVIGTYRVASGGFGRGAAPFGLYEIGAFRGLDDDPHHIGERFMLRAPGRDDGEVWDPKIKALRTFIELHRCHREPPATEGCLCVVGDLPRWNIFIAQIRFLIAWHGGISFVIAGEPDAPQTSNPLLELSDVVATRTKPRNLARPGQRRASGSAQRQRRHHR